MGYFDIFKDKGSQKKHVKKKKVGHKAVSNQAKKRSQLREAAGSGSSGEYPKPTKKPSKLRKRKKHIKGLFDRLKRK